MKIKLSEERHKELVKTIKSYYLDELDEEITDFRAKELLDFFIKKAGPTIYNQAINDAHVFIQGKLEDLSGDLYIPKE